MPQNRAQYFYIEIYKFKISIMNYAMIILNIELIPICNGYDYGFDYSETHYVVSQYGMQIAHTHKYMRTLNFINVFIIR